jgi:hypothetical protein
MTDMSLPSRFSHFSTLAVPSKLKMKPVFRWLAILLSVIGLVFTDVSYSLLVPPRKAPDDPIGDYDWGSFLLRFTERFLEAGG